MSEEDRELEHLDMNSEIEFLEDAREYTAGFYIYLARHEQDEERAKALWLDEDCLDEYVKVIISKAFAESDPKLVFQARKNVNDLRAELKQLYGKSHNCSRSCPGFIGIHVPSKWWYDDNGDFIKDAFEIEPKLTYPISNKTIRA